MIHACQRRATITWWPATIDKRERMMQDLEAFMSDFVRDLNQRSDEGWAVLVEGKRDEEALRALGYSGTIATSSSLSRLKTEALGKATGAIILTDFDREGRTLAARFARRLSHEGFRTSLSERRRLQAAVKGIFLHIENLSRFAERDGP